jgi:hypothetical protein
MINKNRAPVRSTKVKHTTQVTGKVSITMHTYERLQAYYCEEKKTSKFRP